MALGYILTDSHFDWGSEEVDRTAAPSCCSSERTHSTSVADTLRGASASGDVDDMVWYFRVAQGQGVSIAVKLTLPPVIRYALYPRKKTPTPCFSMYVSDCELNFDASILGTGHFVCWGSPGVGERGAEARSGESWPPVGGKVLTSPLQKSPVRGQQ
jgi:hypothetical protein